MENEITNKQNLSEKLKNFINKEKKDLANYYLLIILLIVFEFL